MALSRSGSFVSSVSSNDSTSLPKSLVISSTSFLKLSLISTTPGVMFNSLVEPPGLGATPIGPPDVAAIQAGPTTAEQVLAETPVGSFTREMFENTEENWL